MSAKTEPAGDAREAQAHQAGRGGLAVLGAKVFFMVMGLVQQALLPRAIGLADYGALSRVLAFSNIFNNVVVTSSTQGVSRTVAAAGAAERQALRATLRVHGVIAAVAAILLGISAPLVAHFEHAGDVLAPLVVMTGVLAVYGVYAPLVGYLNGRRLFSRQAALDVCAATLRTGGLLGVGYLFSRHARDLAHGLGTSPGVLGATAGAVGGSLCVFLLALRWTGTGEPFSARSRPAGVPAAGVYTALLVPIMVAQFFTNGLMQADILLLGRYLSLAAPGATEALREKSANEWVAVYRSCQLFAFLPYQILFSVTQVLFPMLAHAKAEEGEARVAELVRRGSRIGAIVCGLLVAVILAIPESLVKFAYGAEVAARAASTLHVLGVGQAAFAMFGLAMTVLVSLGREKLAMALTTVALVTLGLANVVLVPRAAFGEAQLVAAATATTLALAASLVVATIAVQRVAGAFIPLKTAARVGLALAAAFALGGHLPVFSKLLTPVVAAGLGLAYLAVLVGTREVGREDLALVLSIAARRAKR